MCVRALGVCVCVLTSLSRSLSLSLFLSRSLSLSISLSLSLVQRDGAHVAEGAVEEMLAELDEDEDETINLAEFWREIDGAKEMRLS